MADTFKAWTENFDKSHCLPIPLERHKTESDTSYSFSINVKYAEGLVSKSGRTNCQFGFRLSLFDSIYKQFFGKTWVGPVQKPTISGQKIKLNYNQNVYFHTPVKDQNVLVVFEIYSQSLDDAGKEQDVSCGWGLFRLFAYDGEMKDVASGQMGPVNKVSMYHGTPRALFYLDEPIEENPNLKEIINCQTQFHVRTHKALRKVHHLIPENVILGTKDYVPGLCVGPREPNSAPDNFKKPKAQKSMSCHLTNVAIKFSPSVDKFEEQLLKMLDEDMSQRENQEGSSVQILNRYLQVGVHNGWSYISEPEIIKLQQDTGTSSYKKNSSFRKGHKRSGSGGSQSMLSGVKELVHKNSVEIVGLMEDAGLALVFFIVYECGVGTASTDKSKVARSSFNVSIRWAPFSPFTSQKDEHTVELFGGPGQNPDSLLVFRVAEVMGSSGELKKLGAGKLSFTIHLNDQQDKENIVPATHQQVNQSLAPSVRPVSPVSDSGSVLNDSASFARPPKPPSRQGGDFQVPTSQDVKFSPRHAYHQQMQAAYPMMQQNMYQGQMGYMPVEIKHMPMEMGSPYDTARAGELNELPFTPVHAPIVAAAPGVQSGSKLSRAAYAKLYTAGFPPILDVAGEAPEVVDPSDDLQFVLAKEEAAKLQANEIYFQFLAYSKIGSMYVSQSQQSTVFFTFQFYRFPQITTDRLMLGKAQGDLSCDPNAVPCLLRALDKDGSVRKGPPGYQIKYDLDPSFMKPGEGRMFSEHLSQQTLHIDVWDGDSLHLIGSCAVELQHLCRQGRNAVQVTYELDVVSTEYIEHESTISAGDLTRDGSIRPVDINTMLKGRLHLRMANVGHQPDGKFSRTGSVPLMGKSQKVINSGSAMNSFLGGSLSSLNCNTRTILNKKVAKAQPLVQSNKELASVLFTHKGKIPDEVDNDKEKLRKLARMAKIRQMEGNQENKHSYSFRLEKEERARDLKTIEMYRQQTKREGIQAMLNQSISTEHTIHPCMGTTEFFEFILKNPYNHEFTVIVDSDDPDLAPVTNTREWRHLKMMNELYTAIEEGLFNLDTKSGKPEIFLKPKEKVTIPFKYLTFKADHSVNCQNQAFAKKTQQQEAVIGKSLDHLNTKLSRVIFRSQSDDKPMSILAVRVEPQPHVIDQTFRFHHPEQSFLKKSIRMPPLHSIPGVFPGSTEQLAQVYVRCSDPNVICESKKVQQGEPHDIFIKVASGASPQVKRFFVAMYLDPYLSKPIQVWQFYLHSMQRVDVACVEGQTSRFTLVLKGTQASRLVQCYPSHPTEMQLHPTEPFMLPANSLQEVHVGIRPQQTGCKFLYINVVDIEYRQLIRSWLVCVSSRVPVISKAFELHLPLGGGKGSNKKITYTNPYPHEKVFYMRTNRDDLLQFRETRLAVGGGQTTAVGLKFAPNMHQGSTEILVFINDEDDKNEETFCIKAIYQ